MSQFDWVTDDYTIATAIPKMKGRKLLRTKPENSNTGLSARAERFIIMYALSTTKTVKAACELLGIGERTMTAKKKLYDLVRGEKPKSPRLEDIAMMLKIIADIPDTELESAVVSMVTKKFTGADNVERKEEVD